MGFFLIYSFTDIRLLRSGNTVQWQDVHHNGANKTDKLFYSLNVITSDTDIWISLLYGTSVTDKSLFILINANDEFSLCAAFSLNFYLFIVSWSEECNSSITSVSINHHTTQSCLHWSNRSPPYLTMHIMMHQNV